VTVKALQIAVSNGVESQHRSWDCSYFMTTRAAAARAYAEAGITKPREQVSLVEVHDCFSITELVTLEDLGISGEGGGVNDVLDGFYDAGGRVPCQIDGGLKCFGHPIGASGLRMIYENYLQLLGRAGERAVGELREHQGAHGRAQRHAAPAARIRFSIVSHDTHGARSLPKNSGARRTIRSDSCRPRCLNRLTSLGTDTGVGFRPARRFARQTARPVTACAGPNDYLVGVIGAAPTRL